MIDWLSFYIAIPAIWLPVTILLIRPMMRRIMLKRVCRECGYDRLCEHMPRYKEDKLAYKERHYVVRGSKFERDAIDAAFALVNAALWPVWVPPVLAWQLAKGTCEALLSAVVRAVPLTGPELERLNEERARSIKRLTDEINGPAIDGELCHEDPPETAPGVCVRCGHRFTDHSNFTRGRDVVLCPQCPHGLCVSGARGRLLYGHPDRMDLS